MQETSNQKVISDLVGKYMAEIGNKNRMITEMQLKKSQIES